MSANNQVSNGMSTKKLLEALLSVTFRVQNGAIVPVWSPTIELCAVGTLWSYNTKIFMALQASGTSTSAGPVAPAMQAPQWSQVAPSVATSSTDVTQKLTDLTNKVTLLDSLRMLQIGVPRIHRSTILPARHVWVNGDFIPFEGNSEFYNVYINGGFNGLLLPHNASQTTRAANKGMFRPNSATPTGLYLPVLGNEFIRCWVNGLSRTAGSTQLGAMKNLYGTFGLTVGTTNNGIKSMYAFDELSGVFNALTRSQASFIGGGWDGLTSNKRYKAVFDASTQVEVDTEFRPGNTMLPVFMYIGEA